MPPKRKSVESRSRQLKPRPNINFQWGIEFETHSIIMNENGKDKVSIWEDGKSTITSEWVDINKNLHPAPFHECKINETDTSSNPGCLFNLESQLGIFNGLSLDEFNEEYDKFSKEYKTFIENKEITINGLPYKIFSFKHFDNESLDAYVDGKLETHGSYKTNKNDFIGYVKELDTLGVAQMTCTFELCYLPNLFKLMAENIMKDPVYFYFEYIYSLVYNESLEFMKLMGMDHSDSDYLTTFGFIIYMVYFWKVYFEKIVSDVYFKAKFPIKPRTNPAGLYQNMNQNVKNNLQKLADILELKKFSQDTLPIYIYLYESIKELDHPIKAYYIKNLKNSPNNFYLFHEDLTEDIIKQYEPDVEIEKDVPFFYFIYEKNQMTSQISTLFLEDNMIKDTMATIEVFEWMADKDNISIEFRLFKELIVLSDRMATTKKDKKIGEELVDVERLNIDQVKQAINLIFSVFIKDIFKPMDHTDSIKVDEYAYEEYDKDLYDLEYVKKYGKLQGITSYHDFVDKINKRFDDFKKLLHEPTIIELLLSPEIKEMFTQKELFELTLEVEKGNFKNEELLEFQNILNNAVIDNPMLDKESIKSYLNVEQIKNNLELKRKMLYFFPDFDKVEIFTEKQEEIFKEVIMLLPNDKIQKIGEYFRTNIPKEDLLAKIDEGPVALQIYIWNQIKHL